MTATPSIDASHTRIVDCDVHDEIVSEQEIWEYLSPAWREYVRGPEPDRPITIAAGVPWQNPHGFYREDLLPPDGSPAGSLPALMTQQLLEEQRVSYAILTGETRLYVGGLPNPHFAQDVVRAFNDNLADRWLASDRRYLAAISLPVQTPDAAAVELRRMSEHPQVVEAMLCVNAVGRPFGHPAFDPIHHAAAETGLPIAVHSFGEGVGASAAEALAGGRPSFYTEFHSGAMQAMMTHLLSFILHGVFERYRDLRLVLLEGGIEWVPSFLMRLDANYQGLRREVPWCKRLPSEYVREHVFFSTQPLDVPSASHPFWATLEEAGLEGNLLFATDYPHWDADTPRQTLARIPKHLRERVLFRNADKLYSLDG